MQYINTALQLIFALTFLIIGIVVAINGRWWSVHGQSYSAIVDVMIHLMGIGLIIFALYYGLCVIKDVINKKASKENKF